MTNTIIAVYKLDRDGLKRLDRGVRSHDKLAFLAGVESVCDYTPFTFKVGYFDQVIVFADDDRFLDIGRIIRILGEDPVGCVFIVMDNRGVFTVHSCYFDAEKVSEKLYRSWIEVKRVH